MHLCRYTCTTTKNALIAQNLLRSTLSVWLQPKINDFVDINKRLLGSKRVCLYSLNPRFSCYMYVNCYWLLLRPAVSVLSTCLFDLHVYWQSHLSARAHCQVFIEVFAIKLYCLKNFLWVVHWRIIVTTLFCTVVIEKPIYHLDIAYSHWKSL